MERDLTTYYSERYAAKDDKKWRALGAAGKAKNILDLATAAELAPSRVCEIGCGDGAVLLELTRHGPGEEFQGYEIAENIADLARAQPFERATEVSVFDGQTLPEAGDSYDLAILSHVIEHVEAPRTLIYEAARVAPYVFVEVPLELHARTPRHLRWSDVGHINAFNPLLIRHLVESCGLNIVGERVTNHSRDVFQYLRPGLAGSMVWVIKEGLLRAAQPVATRVFTYHGCLLARR